MTEDGCRRPDPRHRSAVRGPPRRARARSSRSTSATRRAPTSAGGGPRDPSYFLKPSSSVAASGGTDRAARRHRAARVRGRDRPRHRHGRTARVARRRVGPRRAGSPPRTTSASTTCARTTRARTCAPRAATASRRSARRSSTPARSTPPRCALRTWVNGELAPGRLDRRPALPARPARRRPLAALHPRAGRRHPHRHARRLVRRRAGRRRRGRGRRARRARRAELRPARDDRDAGRRQPSIPRSASLPAVDDTQRAEAWGSPRGRRASTPERPTRSDAEHAPPTPCVRPRSCAPSCAARPSPGSQRAAAQARAEQRARSTACGRCMPSAKLVGTAQDAALRPEPRGPLRQSHGGGYNAQKRAFDAVGEGEVIVIEARGETGSGTLGDILALRAHARGAAGHRHRRRRPRLRRRRRRRHPGVLAAARTPRSSAASTCRGTST